MPLDADVLREVHIIQVAMTPTSPAWSAVVRRGAAGPVAAAPATTTRAATMTGSNTKGSSVSVGASTATSLDSMAATSMDNHLVDDEFDAAPAAAALRLAAGKPAGLRNLGNTCVALTICEGQAACFLRWLWCCR